MGSGASVSYSKIKYRSGRRATRWLYTRISAAHALVGVLLAREGASAPVPDLRPMEHDR